MSGIKLKRKLKSNEIEFAKVVFANSLPYDRIYVSNTIGAGKRQYTTPEGKHDGGWVLHLGAAIYPDAAVYGLSVFVHELVHVWQSYNSPIRWGYAADSMCQQIVLLKGKRAYDYEVGKNWSEYHAEQQAQLVEDWYVGGLLDGDERFPYIRDHIRRGVN